MSSPREGGDERRDPRRRRRSEMFGLQASGAAASWVVGRMGTDAHLYDDPDDASIPTLLDSRFDADKLDALKRLLALIAQGVDVAHFFPQVILLLLLASSPSFLPSYRPALHLANCFVCRLSRTWPRNRWRSRSSSIYTSSTTLRSKLVPHMHSSCLQSVAVIREQLLLFTFVCFIPD